MNRTLFALFCWLAAALPAAASQALALQKNCLSCHGIENKVTGPAYKDVAKKYAGQDVSARLATKVMNGGTGVWGTQAMPANPQVSRAEAEALIRWVLSLQ